MSSEGVVVGNQTRLGRVSYDECLDHDTGKWLKQDEKVQGVVLMRKNQHTMVVLAKVKALADDLNGVQKAPRNWFQRIGDWFKGEKPTIKKPGRLLPGVEAPVLLRSRGPGGADHAYGPRKPFGRHRPGRGDFDDVPQQRPHVRDRRHQHAAGAVVFLLRAVFPRQVGQSFVHRRRRLRHHLRFDGHHRREHLPQPGHGAEHGQTHEGPNSGRRP